MQHLKLEQLQHTPWRDLGLPRKSVSRASRFGFVCAQPLRSVIRTAAASRMYDARMDHLPAHLLPHGLDVKCLKCGWVHRSISPSEAAKTCDSNELARLSRCFNCGTPSAGFVLAQPADAPSGSSVQPVLIRA